MTGSEFKSNGGSLNVTQDMKDAYVGNGYVLIRNLLSPAEVAKLKGAVDSSDGVQKHAYSRTDGGAVSKLCIWKHPGQDVTGMVARSNKVADTAEQLMGGDEIYHFSTKLMMKDAKTGGGWCWHQDYGYYYFNGNLFPELATVFIAIDNSNKANGCLKIIEGSHRIGRVDHFPEGDQMMADNQRVKQALSVLDLKYMEMSPGDALFFHCNLLHTSEQNTSDLRRWCLAITYNKKKNSPFITGTFPRYNPLNKVPDSAIMESCVCDLEGKEFVNPDDDKVESYTKKE